MPKGAKNWIKNPFCPKPAHMYRYRLVVYRYMLATAPFCITCIGTVRPVPVHLGHCLFLHNMYRYMLDLYRYTCSNSANFFFLFFYIYIFPNREQ